LCNVEILTLELLEAMSNRVGWGIKIKCRGSKKEL